MERETTDCIDVAHGRGPGMVCCKTCNEFLGSIKAGIS
jgi:hypothetical protein